jgi:hypothetical protein
MELCFVSPFWCLEFFVGSKIFVRFAHPGSSTLQKTGRNQYGLDCLTDLLTAFSVMLAVFSVWA